MLDLPVFCLTLKTLIMSQSLILCKPQYNSKNDNIIELFIIELKDCILGLILQ